MSKNVNVFIGVLLCAVLCGTFVWLSSSGDESSWSPNDIYNEVQGTGSVGGYATTSATFSGPSNDGGVALPMSSSSMRARTSYKHAGAYSGAATMPLTSNLSPLTYGAASGAGLYTTSSAEIKSFGGGGNGGAAMSYSQSSISNLQSPIANSQSPIANLQSPIAYSTARRGGMSSAVGDDLAMMAAENPVMAMTNAASVGMGNAVYAGVGYTTMGYYGTASYGGGRGMQGRRNANSIGGNVLNDWIMSLIGDTESGYMYEYGGIYYFDENTLRELYNAAIANGELPTGVTWEQFLDWFKGQSNIYQFPIPDGAWFLCLLALGYTIYIIYRRKKQIQVQ